MALLVVYADITHGTHNYASAAGSLADTSPKQADIFDGISDLALHGVDPTAGNVATSHIPQALVQASPVSHDHPCNLPEGYTTDVSSLVSPTANVSCCSGSGGIARIVASTSQHDSDQALEALQPTKETGGARSDAEGDKMASEVLSLPVCMVRTHCCCWILQCFLSAYCRFTLHPHAITLPQHICR